MDSFKKLDSSWIDKADKYSEICPDYETTYQIEFHAFMNGVSEFQEKAIQEIQKRIDSDWSSSPANHGLTIAKEILKYLKAE
jgi:hypothetical protein